MNGGECGGSCREPGCDEISRSANQLRQGRLSCLQPLPLSLSRSLSTLLHEDSIVLLAHDEGFMNRLGDKYGYSCGPYRIRLS